MTGLKRKEAHPKMDLPTEATESRRVGTSITVAPETTHRLDGFCWCQPTAEADLDGDGHVYVHRQMVT